MKNVIAVFVIALGAFSCQESEVANQEFEMDRLSFVQGKSKLEQKEDFGKLNFSQQKSLWLSKLGLVESRNLSTDFNSEIGTLIEILRSVHP